MKALPLCALSACVWLAAIGHGYSQALAPEVPGLPPEPPTNTPRLQVPQKLLRARMEQQAGNALAARAIAITNAPGASPIVRPIPFFPPLASNRLTSVPQAFRPQAAVQPASYMAWDAEKKATNVASGLTNVHFSFWLTNVSTEDVLVHSVRTSCGCAVAQLPAYPWRLTPGSNGPIQVTVDLRGKMGSFEKNVMVDTSTGIKSLIVEINMPVNPSAPGGGDMERLKNMRLAMADRQVVFKGECAKCHSEPATGKSGEPLYAAVCANCHDSVHRAALVPDLKALNHPTSPEHWHKWIVEGKTGTMMPAFAQSAGGPLTEEQVQSLVQFLTETITNKPRNAAAPTNSPPRAALETSRKVQ